MGREAVNLRLTWADSGPPELVGRAPFVSRPVTPADAPALGRLMWACFRGTVDDEGETPEDAEAEIAETLRGKWGPVVWPASPVAHLHDQIVSAAVAVLETAHGGLPLLAYLMTDPRYRGRGAGRQLIGECLRELHALDSREVHLTVTRGNPAFALYRGLGFVLVDSTRG